MHLFDTGRGLNEYLKKARDQGRQVGFVPTMGALHQGHLALVKHSAAENDETVVSIFVNPTQFNNQEDLRKYPRNPQKDIDMLEGSGCTAVFLPSEKEIYPKGTRSKVIDLGGLAETMEGAHRPGHFDGVATVVWRFFELVKPDNAYFGEKDYQQLRIITFLAKSKNLPVAIVPHPIERNKDGLALSSRNQLLSTKDQDRALALYRALEWARQNYRKHTPKQVKEHISNSFKKEDLNLEYAEVVDDTNLQHINSWDDAEHARIFLAASVSGVRLIDNLLLF